MFVKKDLIARGVAFAMVGFMGFSGMSITAFAGGPDIAENGTGSADNSTGSADNSTGDGAGANQAGAQETPAQMPTAVQNPQTAQNENMGYGVGSNGFNVFGIDNGEKVKTTCGDNGFKTYEAVSTGNNAPNTPTTTINKINNDNNAFEYGEKYTNGDITTSITSSLTDTSTVITYYVQNNSGTDQTVYIGSSADTMIGVGENASDRAVVSFIDNNAQNKGLTMVGDGYTIELRPGADHDFTTLWYGLYSQASSNVFKSLDNTNPFVEDSGIAYSWKIVVPAKTTLTRSAIFALWKQLAPNIPNLPPVPEIVQDPELKEAEPQIVIVSTDAGNELPTTGLGDAAVPTKTLALDISTVTPAQYKEAVENTIKSVGAGGNLVLETSVVSCFDTAMIETLASRNDISVDVVFMHNGQKMLVRIPAGYDVKTLLDENGYCGFLRLADMLGYSIIG